MPVEEESSSGESGSGGFNLGVEGNDSDSDDGILLENESSRKGQTTVLKPTS